VYWWIAGWQIYFAFTNPYPMYFTWWSADALAWPWSLSNPLIGKNPWLQAAIDGGGIILNGLLFVWFARWLTSGQSRRVMSQEKTDFDDRRRPS
jgi:hypothetical protein